MKKQFRVKAYTSADKKHLFASCTVEAENRAEALRKAIAREITSDPIGWNAGAGHTMTASVVR